MKIINPGFIFVIFIFSLNTAANEINVEKCIKLINDSERLMCYDNLFRANEKTVAPVDREPRQENTLDKVITNQPNNIDQNDIDQNHTLFSDIDAVNKILDIEVGISFFPQDGIFDQMISTGSFELIKNMELKKLLLEMYNHQKIVH